MKKSTRFFALTAALGLAVLPFPARAQTGSAPVQNPKPHSSLPTPASTALQSIATPLPDSGPMPFSNEEANFYRRAWPVDKSHSAGALILYGTVLVTIASLIIRAMAKSGPRKPPRE